MISLAGKGLVREFRDTQGGLRWVVTDGSRRWETKARKPKNHPDLLSLRATAVRSLEMQLDGDGIDIASLKPPTDAKGVKLK